MFELFQSCSVSQLSFKFDVLSNGLDVEPMRQGLMPVLRTLPAGQQGAGCLVPSWSLLNLRPLTSRHGANNQNCLQILPNLLWR